MHFFFKLASFYALVPPNDTGSSPLFNKVDWVSLSSLSAFSFISLSLILLVGLFFGYLSTTGAPLKTRLLLFILRTALAVLILAFIAEPGLLQKATSRLTNRVVVLVDTSASMQQEASNGVKRSQVAGRAAQKIESLLSQKEAPFQIENLAYDLDVQALSTQALENMSFGTLQAQGKRTRIETALQSIQKSPEGQPPLGGIVVITDGADTEGHEKIISEATLSHLKELNIPVHSVWTRSTSAFFDRSVHDVISDNFAFVRNQVTLDVVLRHRGVPQNAQAESLPLTLREDGHPLQIQSVVLDGIEGEKHIQITFEPKQAGKHVYTLDLPVHPDESIALNNQFSFPLEIIRDRIRVLQVVGRPSWDERFVRRLLKENPSVDLISFFILRTTTSVPSAANHELSLIPFPTRELFTEELNTFDVVIFQNFDYAPYSMGHYLKNVANFVTESGGGFMMLGGNLSFSEAGYDGTVIEDILPFRLRAGRGHINESHFHPRRSLAGQTHPITDMGTLLSQSADPFNALPKLEGINLVAGLQPGTEVLLVHPRLRLPNGDPHPVLAAREVGKGRSIALLTDSSWLWSLPHVGTGGRGDAHRKLFANALRWLIRDPELSRVKVKASKSIYEPDEAIVLEVRSFSQAYAPKGSLKVQIKISQLDGAAQNEIVLSEVTDKNGRLQIEKKDLGTGAFRVEVICEEEGRKIGSDEDAFIVRAGSLEQIFSEPRGEGLALLAKETNGKRVAPNDVEKLDFIDQKVERVHRQKSEPIWNRASLAFLLTLLAGIEWYVRRRRGFA